MRLPYGAEVPFTSGISGIVFVAAWFKVGTTQMIPALSLIGGVWGLIYLAELSVIRRRRGRLGRGPAPEVAPPAATDAGRT